MKKQFVALILRSLFALLLACTLVRAEEAPNAPQLQKLKHVILSPTSEQVILQLNGSYSPKVFTLKDENPRLVFDFDGMTCGKDVKGLTTANSSIVKRVRVGMHEGNPPKTRIVFDVATFKGLNYTQKFNEDNSTLVVQFTGPAASPRQQDKAAVPAPAKEAAAAPVATGEGVAAAAIPQKQVVAPLPSLGQDEQEKATGQMAQPEPTPPPAPAPGTVKSEEPVKEAVAQPAPDSKKEKKGKAAQTQETQPQPEAAPTKKAGEAVADAKKPEAAEKPAILSKVSDKPQIEYVKFDDSSPKGEMVMFKLNGFHPPAIHGVEEGIPRVICDFSNTKLLQTNKGPIKANGKFVKIIRTTVTQKPEKVRVVIDLEPNLSYDLQQVFFKEDNLFVLIVNSVKK